MDKENVVHTYIMEFDGRPKIKWDCDIFKRMDVNENHHVKQNNPGLVRQIPHGLLIVEPSFKIIYVCVYFYMCVFIGDKIQKKIMRYEDIFKK